MKKLFALLVCLLLLFALASCDDDPCSHRDADDNSLCDNCGESYTDGKDIADSTPCQHRDADDNSLCDKCGESYTDGKDLPDEHTHDYTVKSTDNKYLDKAAVKELSAIPSKDVLIAKMLGCLQSSISKFVYVLDSIAKAKEAAN